MSDFHGYCLTPDGFWTPDRPLDTAQDVFYYVNLQRKLFPEVRITDDEDYIVVQAIGGKVTYPPEWVDLFKKIDGNRDVHPLFSRERSDQSNV